MITEIKEILLAAKEELIQDAKRIEKEFWDQRHVINNNKDWKDKGVIGLRVRVRKRREMPSLEIEWFKMYFFKNKSSGKLTMQSTYLRKGKGHSYPLKIFNKIAQDWEMELIEEAEHKIALIRECSVNIGKVSVVYCYLNKSHEKYQEAMNDQ